jgi:hypothetical protein
MVRSLQASVELSQPTSGGNVASVRRIGAAGGRFDVRNFTNFPRVHNVFCHGGGGVGQGEGDWSGLDGSPSAGAEARTLVPVTPRVYIIGKGYTYAHQYRDRRPADG